MKYIIICFVLLSLNLSSELLAQNKIKLTNNNEIQYLDNLSNQKTTTVADAFALYYKFKFNKISNYNTHKNAIVKIGAINKEEYKTGKELLKRGLLAQIIATELNLKNSLLYIIFGSDRYAYRACAASFIMPHGKSSYDLMSGQELIEAMHFLSNN